MERDENIADLTGEHESGIPDSIEAQLAQIERNMLVTMRRKMLKQEWIY